MLAFFSNLVGKATEKQLVFLWLIF
ncbi:uncharacterized protein METZ01_LOCUS121542, partial [marine metagenome]